VRKLGKQIQFLLDEITENKFVQFILSEGNTHILLNGNAITELPKPFSVEGWFKVYLYRPTIGELIIEIINENLSFIRPLTSPVIEFSRTVLRNDKKEISLGRLWVETKYFDEIGNKVEKPKELNIFYNQLVKWIKKELSIKEINNEGYIQKVYTTEKMYDTVKMGYKVL
jgi:hypothetical protein